jgi:hypothetical protein
MPRRASYDRCRGRRPPDGWARRLPSSSLPTSTATALQELGLIVPTGPALPPGRREPAGRGTWQAVAELPQGVLFLLSFTCFGLLLALVAWHPWR